MEELPKVAPPKLFHSFFSWYCNPEFREDIEGDLLERFHNHIQQYGNRRAKYLYAKDVVLLFRLSLIRNSIYLNRFNMKSPNLLRIAVVCIMLVTGMIYVIKRQVLFQIPTIAFSKLAKTSQKGMPILSEVSSVSNLSENSVSYKEWSEFLVFMKNDTTVSKEYVQTIVPDQWNSISEVKRQSNEPVNGVSWYQANEFLKWRSVLVTYSRTHVGGQNYEQMMQLYSKAKVTVTYRLPTGDEFVRFAAQKEIDEKENMDFKYVRFVNTAI